MRAMDGVRAGLRGLVIMGAPLLAPLFFIPGADRGWPSGWVFLAVYAVMAIGGSVLLARFRPDSLKVRMEPFVARKGEKQPLLDAIGLPVFLTYVIAWMAFIPIDVFRLHLFPPPPMALSSLGLALSIAGMTMGQLAVAQNRFAAPTVQDQTPNGQHVIDTGLYGVVRHPLYAANLLVFSGEALWLGSYAGVLGVLVILLFTLARIPVEEGQLRATLPDYADYARRVKSRLIPGVF